MNPIRPILILLLCALCCACGKKEQAEPEEENEEIKAMKERLADAQKLSRQVREVQAAIRQFSKDVGRLPRDVTELKKLDYIDEIPVAPEGQVFHFDPARGNYLLLTREKHEYLVRILTTPTY